MQLHHALGEEAEVYTGILRALLPSIDGAEYTFASTEFFLGQRSHAINRIYWTEILFRTHWVASGTLIRTLGWLDAIAMGHGAGNLFAFAAACRGLIESAADSAVALSGVAATLARDHAMICDAIAGRLISPTVNPEVEEQLIHFTHARKLAKGESAPDSHRARQIVGYRAYLEGVEPRIPACYSLLCDITHPGATSVLSFAVAAGEEPTTVRLSLSEQTAAISRVSKAVQECTPWVLSLGLNEALVTLKVLRHFAVPSVQLPAIDSVDLSSIPAWTKAARLLSEAD